MLKRNPSLSEEGARMHVNEDNKILNETGWVKKTQLIQGKRSYMNDIIYLLVGRKDNNTCRGLFVFKAIIHFR